MIAAFLLGAFAIILLVYGIKGSIDPTKLPDKNGKIYSRKPFIFITFISIFIGFMGLLIGLPSKTDTPAATSEVKHVDSTTKAPEPQPNNDDAFRIPPPSPEEIKAIELKAKNGNAEAQCEYARRFCTNNKKQFIYWMTKAARNGNPEAQNRLGFYYWIVCKDDPRHLEKAFAWIKTSAYNKYYLGQRNMASFYRSDTDDNFGYKNDINAYAWSKLIVLSGSEEVDQSDTANLQYIRNKLTSEGELMAGDAKAEALYNEIYGDI